MSEPIIEQIALWLQAALAEITEPNGYQQTLSVQRPEDPWLDAESIEDLTCILAQTQADPLDGTVEEIVWKQGFEITVFFTAVRDAVLSVDTRINRAVSDIFKRLGLDIAAKVSQSGRLCGGLARAIEYEGVGIDTHDELAMTLVTVSIAVIYSVNRLTPYE